MWSDYDKLGTHSSCRCSGSSRSGSSSSWVGEFGTVRWWWCKELESYGLIVLQLFIGLQNKAKAYIVLSILYFRTRPRLILESSPFTMASTKTVIPVNSELRISYKEPIAKDFTLHIHHDNQVRKLFSYFSYDLEYLFRQSPLLSSVRQKAMLSWMLLQKVVLV